MSLPTLSCSVTAGVVQVRDATLNIVEGSMLDFCVILTGTDGSPNLLENQLTVTFSTMLTGKAGRPLQIASVVNTLVECDYLCDLVVFCMAFI